MSQRLAVLWIAFGWFYQIGCMLGSVGDGGRVRATTYTLPSSSGFNGSRGRSGVLRFFGRLLPVR